MMWARAAKPKNNDQRHRRSRKVVMGAYQFKFLAAFFFFASQHFAWWFAGAAMMHMLTFRAIATARCLPFVVLFAALRCAVGWRGGSTRLRCK